MGVHLTKEQTIWLFDFFIDYYSTSDKEDWDNVTFICMMAEIMRKMYRVLPEEIKEKNQSFKAVWEE